MGYPDGADASLASRYTAEIESDEGRPAFVARDGTFELVYWRFGLSLANAWRERQGLPPEERWVTAERGICSPVPRPLNGTVSLLSSASLLFAS